MTNVGVIVIGSVSSLVHHMFIPAWHYMYWFTVCFRYLYITILRDPVQRYLSEWRHVHRGATWMAAELRCNGRSATLQEVPFCFSGTPVLWPFILHVFLYSCYRAQVKYFLIHCLPPVGTYTLLPPDYLVTELQSKA